MAKTEIGTAYTAWGLYETDGVTQPHVFILVKDDRAIAIFVVRRRRWEETALGEDLLAVCPSRHEERRWNAEIIWLASRHRGMGYARLLINLALFHLETVAQEMVLSTPFSESGEMLVRSLTGESFYAG